VELNVTEEKVIVSPPLKTTAELNVPFVRLIVFAPFKFISGWNVTFVKVRVFIPDIDTKLVNVTSLPLSYSAFVSVIVKESQRS